jgi:hypothetical protein
MLHGEKLLLPVNADLRRDPQVGGLGVAFVKTSLQWRNA